MPIDCLRRASSHPSPQSQPQPQLPAQSPTPTTALAGVPTLLEFVNTVPSPLTTLLVGLAPSASLFRRAVEVLSWKSSWEESWLAIAVWWGVCLFSGFVLRYLLPVAILATVAFSRWKSRPPVPAALPPVTEGSLQLVISDFSTVFTLLPIVPSLPLTPLAILLRVFAFLYVPYLVLTYFVRLSIIIGIAGTLLLSWRAPWAALIRANLWSSAWIRWSIYRLWSFLSGLPLPAQPLSLQASTKPQPNVLNTVRFLFTIYENQRWWMGLDWTAALLPGERPSWCSASQQPVPPPSAFTLPNPTIAYLSDGKGGRVKRVAMWGWDESEWKVVVRKEGEGSSRVERPLPVPKEESTGNSSSGRLFRAAGKMMEASASASGSGPTPGPGSASRNSFPVSPKANDDHAEGENGEQAEANNADTDGDGWVYGDNKWEGRSGKGGMGKYTRFRRWTRIAVLTELVENVGPGETGIVADDDDIIPYEPSTTPKQNDSAPSVNRDDAASSHSAEDLTDESRGLKQRLKAVVAGVH
ncbi:hypothetical protein EW146_g7638 [Bondarzewia mesenterica]|uniref:Peroxin/Ferlin domain-containing protein n=1 Tax=Bondarzewia mesenterica TaxID=1095465 RepID=A0A4S4LKS7_9AGAM|nr:hypothetical protein EW146_g7638 [Bondarzewia mesenterica]